MVVLVAFDRESNDDGVEKRRVIDDGVVATKIVTNIEFKFVKAGRQGLVFKQRFFRTTVGIGQRIGHLLAPLSQRKQTDGDTCRRTSRSGIEDMCR